MRVLATRKVLFDLRTLRNPLELITSSLMELSSTTQSEIRLTLDALMVLTNGIRQSGIDLRSTLDDRGFSRAPDASAAAISRLTSRLEGLRPLVETLSEMEDVAAMARVNEELNELDVRPSIVEHGGVGPHIHWTPSTATFDDQVMTDMLMALAQELCDNGTIRFGRCGADDCDDLFYDGTRNRARRFCDDPKCASRTHTADHRARQSRAREAPGKK